MNAARLLVLALAAGLATASSSDDPYGEGPCLAGMVRDPGPACTLPTVADIGLDGSRNEWQDPDALAVLVPGSCCRSGDTGVTYAGRQVSNGALVFFNNTLGSPTPGPLVYGLVFQRADLPEGALGNIVTQVLVRADGSLEEYVNGERVFGAPVEAIMGFEGIEWRIDVRALPYPGAASVIGVTYEATGDTFVARDAPKSSAIICWDEKAEDDPCRAR